MGKQRYMLNDRVVSSRDVLVFLHKARKEKYDPCSCCLKPIEAGQEYFRLNTYDGYIFHKQCFLDDHLVTVNDSFISGVRTRTSFPFGLRQTTVFCKKFTISDLPVKVET